MFVLSFAPVMLCASSCELHQGSEAARGQIVQAEWKQGTSERNSVLAPLRIVAADTLDPVAGIEVQTVLIGPDGGDGGFHTYVTGDDGAVIPRLREGRYQIYLVPPEDSRFVTTQFYGTGNYLVVRDDNAYRPDEFRIAVKPPVSTGNL
ncbi:hypothetical protein [Maioricimonas rarisocia]|nr:hypothetical protein [Maioricimonas rarisocia]